MKAISRAALAAALLAVGGVSVCAPAFAKKEEEKAKGDALTLTPAVRQAAAAAQTALTAKDYATADTALQPAEAAATTDDEKYIVNALRFQIDFSRINAAGGGAAQQMALAKPLDALIANPKTPQAALGQYNFFRGLIAFNGNQYKLAAPYFDRAQQLGYQSSDLPLLIAKTKIEGGDIGGGLTALDAAIKAQQAAGKAVPEDWYRYALSKLQKTTQYDLIDDWNARWLGAYGTPQNWRAAIYVFGFEGAGATRVNKRQRIDLFRLMRATKALAGAAEYSEYAQSAIDVGLPNEAKTVVTEAKASGVLPAGSAQAADLLKQANGFIANDGSVASLEAKAKAAATGANAAQTGDAYLGQGNATKATELYKLALQKGGVDADEVNTHLGIALAQSGDKAGAQAAFALVKTPPRSQIASLWAIWVNGGAAAAPSAPAAS